MRRRRGTRRLHAVLGGSLAGRFRPTYQGQFARHFRQRAFGKFFRELALQFQHPFDFPFGRSRPTVRVSGGWSKPEPPPTRTLILRHVVTRPLHTVVRWRARTMTIEPLENRDDSLTRWLPLYLCCLCLEFFSWHKTATNRLLCFHKQ